jgi:hypothetical protein
MDAAPDPRAGLGGAPPDMSSLGGLAQPASGPGATPQLAPQHRTLNTVLKYVALGLAGSAAGMGEKRPGEAAAAGVRTGIGLVQQGKENARADAAQQADLKFKNLQSAHLAAAITNLDQTTHNANETHIEEMQQFADQHAKTLQDVFGIVLHPLTNTGQAVIDHLKSLNTASAGDGIVTPGNVYGPHTMYVADDNSQSQVAAKLKAYNAYASALGLAPMDSGMWARHGLPGQNQLMSEMQMRITGHDGKGNSLEPRTLPSIIASREKQLEFYKSSSTYDPKVADDVQHGIDIMKAGVAAQDKHDATEAATRGAQVAEAELPVKIATAKGEEKARIDTQLSAANTEGQGARLVEGDMDPSQMSKRSNIYNATLDAADRYSMQKYGKHFDMAKATEDYKFATNTGTQNTLKMLDSLTGRDGRPGDLTTIADLQKKVQRTSFPALNDAAAWAKFQTGNPDEAAFKTGMLEVSDKLAKIFQGGTGSTSDAKMNQAQELVSKSLSNEQFGATMGTLNQLLSNRKGSLIGDNRYLQRQYKVGASAEQQGGSGATPQTHAFSVKAWKAANPTGDENAARTAATKAGYTVTD